LALLRFVVIPTERSDDGPLFVSPHERRFWAAEKNAEPIAFLAPMKIETPFNLFDSHTNMCGMITKSRRISQRASASQYAQKID
jgi:hypothetical protein